MKAIYTKTDRLRHTVNFDTASEEAMNEIHKALVSRWHLEDRPSISLLLACVVRQFAEDMRDDPDALKGLMNEIKARGGAVSTKRNQFQRDQETFSKEGQV